ncbi:hypothetical protein Cni_G23679 [Canna indica]|uniref:DUF4378 domain-containing protein n=1 Tax=Canna indica TaxID=4628 RepID=A0AAQ3KTX7_9LILI|nr:hypothetical protein Cni_G23679 [Canna indica]
MAQLLRHQNSNDFSEKSHFGCIRGFLQYFDHQRLKSLQDSETGHAKQSGSVRGSRLYIPLTRNQHDKLCEEANSKVTKRNSGKALRDLLLKKLFQKLQRKQKMLPVTPQLLRTFSIHHLECNDYVIPEEIATESEEALKSEETNLSQTSEQVPLLEKGIKCDVCRSADFVKRVGQDQLVELGNILIEKQFLGTEKLNAAREAFLKQKELVDKENGTDGALNSEDFIRLFELFDADRELFLKILEDPNSVLESSQLLNGSGVPTNSGIEVGKTSVSTSMDCDLQAVPTNSGIEVGIEHQMHHRAHLNSLKDVTRENGKVIHRISMDGLLHKIPHGQKVHLNALRKNLFRSASARSSEDISSNNIRILPKMYPYRRSRSLTESFDQYPDLVNSVSFRKSKRDSEPSNSIKKIPRIFERIHSNPEFGSYPQSQDTQKVLIRASLPLNESSISPLGVGETVHGFAEPEFAETAFSKPKMECDESMEQICIVNYSEATDKLPVVKINESEQGESYMVTNSTIEHSVHVKLPQQDSGALECSSLGPDFDQMERPGCYLKQKGNALIGVQNLGRIPEVHPSAEPIKQSQISDLLEEIVSPSKYVISKESEHGGLHAEELDSLPEPANSLDVGVSAEVETTESSSSSKKQDGFTNFDAFPVKLDQKDVAEFNFVRDVLVKSGFDGAEFVEAWYFHYQLLDPFVFGKVNRIFDELETASYSSNDTSLDYQLLSDLINEVLLEIYAKSFVRSWFLRMHPNVRPIPEGHHVIEEVWFNICGLLGSQRQKVHTLESVMARDFAMSAWWLNLQRDAESIGMELECLILDDLLDELMPELIDS